MHPALNSMVPPGQKRPRIFRGGIIQIMTTRSCDMSCFGCTAGSNLVSKPATMTIDQFDRAVASLDQFWGITAVFGGNPCTHPAFDEICRIMRARVPFAQRGLWTNNLMGKGAHARITFNPATSNINVHMNSDAWEEFERDWPEALSARKEHATLGLTRDSVHGTPWVSMTDIGVPENERWSHISKCDINQHWSAMICVVRGELRAFFCEVAGHMAALHGDNPDWADSGQPMPDVGLEVEPGWWRKPMAEFERQVLTCCHHCAIPLRRPGQLAIGGTHEEFSHTHRFIARPKVRDRQLVQVGEFAGRGDRPSTEYLDGVTPRA